jgi:GT2 family glycosyltransferase
MLNYTALIVTYANRYKFVEQVIDALIREGLTSIILVDNDSAEESKSYFKNLIDNNSKIKLIQHSENLGSAGGFHSGLQFIINNINSDFIWILDDDNVPNIGSLNNLINARKLLINDNSNDEVVLYSYRGDSWLDDKLAVYNGYIKGYKSNNFIGFNFSVIFKTFFLNKKTTNKVKYPVVSVEIGPYGGMFLSMKTLKKVGLPNKDFFIYADDHEFSLRFDKYNIKQYLVYNSSLKDIHFTFSEGNKFFSKQTSELKLYYSIRNHVFLSQSFVKNKFLYCINKLTYLALNLLISLPIIIKNPKIALERIILIKNAIYDGEMGRLGKISQIANRYQNNNFH